MFRFDQPIPSCHNVCLSHRVATLLPVVFVLWLLSTGGSALASSQTTISVAPATLANGQSGVVNIVMNAQGSESALGFSLNFDPAQLQFVSAQLGADAGDAYIIENDYNAVNGQLGFAIAAQPTGATFASGNLTLLQVTFLAIGTGPTTTMTFGDSPVIREVSGVMANVLPSTFIAGVVSIDQPITAVSLTFLPTSPQSVSKPITLTAKVTGGLNVSYQFWSYNPASTPAWSQLQAYSSSASCQWIPTAPGRYLLAATAKDGMTGVETPVSSWYVITGAPLTAVSFTAAPASPQPANTPITFTATATGGTSIQFQYWLYSAAATPAWRQLQGYSALASYLWSPVTAGNYFIVVTAYDSATGAQANYSSWYIITNPQLTAVTVTPAPSSPQQPNTPITITATATGGANVQYQFWLYNAAGNPLWSQLQAYSSSATCLWMPATAGDYLIAVTARDGMTGTEVNTTSWYIITMASMAVNVTPSPASPQATGTPITFTAAATGETNARFQFWLYNAAGSPAWSQLQAYSSSATCLWKPAAAGSYLIAVTARDGVTGAEVNTTCWYTITTALTAVSVAPSLASPSPVNTPITFTAAATGGTNVRYQFWLYNAASSPAWSQLQAYSVQTSCSWKPTAAGNYLISVTAQDGMTGTEVNATVWYTIL